MIHQPRGKWYRFYIDLAYKFERFDFSYHLYHGDCAVGDAGDFSEQVIFIESD